jgi:hypothetical protein
MANGVCRQRRLIIDSGNGTGPRSRVMEKVIAMTPHPPYPYLGPFLAIIKACGRKSVQPFINIVRPLCCVFFRKPAGGLGATSS